MCGGIVGVATKESKMITKCINQGNVTGSRDTYAGGIVGLFSTDSNDPSDKEPSTLSYCYNTGRIESKEYNAGGIVGTAAQYKTLIEKSYNMGEILASESAGGICGSLGRSSSIQNCYNVGTISTGKNTGGICGYTYNSAGTISNCYNRGEVKTGTKKTSGIVGWNSNNSTIENSCYLEGSVTLSEGNDGEKDLARTADYIKTTFLTNANQTEAIWEIRNGKNNEYPVIISMD